MYCTNYLYIVGLPHLFSCLKVNFKAYLLFMKRQNFIVILSAIIFVGQFFVLTPRALATGEVILNIPAGTYSAAPGGTITIPININVDSASVAPTDVEWHFVYNVSDIVSIDVLSSDLFNYFCSGISGDMDCQFGNLGIGPLSTGEIGKIQITLANSTTATSTELSFDGNNIFAYDNTDSSNPISVPIVAFPASTTLNIIQPVVPAIVVPTISSFTASSSVITFGQSSILSWTTTDAETVNIDNGIGKETATSSGSVIVFPITTTTYILTADNSGVTATSSVTINVSPDIISPIVSLIAPISSSTISGSSVALSATSTDDIEVFGVTFYYDSTNKIGNEITATSSLDTYTTTWDTTSLSNGTHTLIAVSRDSSNNYATSSSVSVTVQNSIPDSPSLEVISIIPGNGPIIGTYNSTVINASIGDSSTNLPLNQENTTMSDISSTQVQSMPSVSSNYKTLKNNPVALSDSDKTSTINSADENDTNLPGQNTLQTPNNSNEAAAVKSGTNWTWIFWPFTVLNRIWKYFF